MPFRRLVITVPVAERAAANNKCLADGRNTAGQHFVAEFNVTGDALPATHYACCWGGLDDSEVAALQTAFGIQAVEVANDLTDGGVEQELLRRSLRRRRLPD